MILWDTYVIDGAVRLASFCFKAASYPARLLQSANPDLCRLRARRAAGADRSLRRSMSHILSYILFLPLAGAAILLAIPSANSRALKIWANVIAVADFALSLTLLPAFDKSTADFQFVEIANWIPTLGVKYYIGIDGISLLLLLLTTVTGSLAILSSWSAIETRLKEYYAMLLLLQAALVGISSRSTSSCSSSSSNSC